jgi:hypothetical protein
LDFRISPALSLIVSLLNMAGGRGRRVRRGGCDKEGGKGKERMEQEKYEKGAQRRKEEGRGG